MYSRKFLKENNGFTLIEVLLSITLLGILVLSVLSFFNQAYSYTKKNEDKTVGINVARNVLYYVEQQDFKKIYDQYIDSLDQNTSKEITINNCNDTLKDSSNETIFDPNVCKGFLKSQINNREFTTKVIISKHENPDLVNYLIPVEVVVSWNNQTATVRGLIKDE